MSNLEKFIRKNRNDFDDATPPGKVWENVEKSLPVKKEARLFSLRDIYKWSAAVAIFFIALTSVYFLFIRKYSHETQTVKTENSGNRFIADDLGNISPEYAAEIKQVSLSVQTRQKELRSEMAGNSELYRKFQDDLNTLDSSYRLLKGKASQSINRDVIIKAMIQNLQLQAELLGRQLMIIHEFKNTKISKNENDI